MKAMFLFVAALTLGQVSSRAQFPAITNQPTSRTVWTGSSITFLVGASSAGPLSYQWQFNTTNLPNAVITTVAGNGKAAYSGDGGAATNASLYGPNSVALDRSGNLFISDVSNSRIRKVDTNGIITTVAGGGSGINGNGDGGAATNISYLHCANVAVDGSGNLFIADSYNNSIRKVDTNGIITTVAGGHTTTYSGDGGAATNAGLYQPAGMAMDDSGNLFIADELHNRVRKVDTNGIIMTVAGGGSGNPVNLGDGGAATNAVLDMPQGVAVDRSGNLFIGDESNNRVRKVDTNGIITTVAGAGGAAFSGDGGAATNASLHQPYGVAVDASGNLFIADSINNHIRKVDTNGIITSVAGGGTGGLSNIGDGGAPTNALVYLPTGVALDGSGNLFIATPNMNRIRKVTNIPQGPALSLTNVTAANAGNYQVVVTSPGGSVTSSTATLVVATSPLIYQTALKSDGSIALCFVNQPGSTNVVVCATNLAPPVLWQPFSTNVAGADGNWQSMDTNATITGVKFFRFQQQ